MGLVTATLPSFDGAAYTVALSADVHPVAGLNLAPGATITLQPDTTIDFSADPDASCPARQTTTTTATTTSTTTTTIYDPANVDCVETISACTAACEGKAGRVYVVQVQPVAKGRACVGAADCEPGEDLCPLPTTKAPESGGGDGGDENDNTVSMVNEDGTINVDAATAAFKAAASTGGIVIAAGGTSYAASIVIPGTDGISVIVTFPTLDLSTTSEDLQILLESSMTATSAAALGVAPKALVFEANDEGGTTVTVYTTEPEVEAAVDPDAGGSPIAIIIGVVVGLLVVGGIAYFVMSKSNDDDGQLPKSMPAGKAGQMNGARTVENPMYEDPEKMADGYIDVGSAEESAAAAAAAAPAKKKKKSGAISKKSVGKRCMVEGFDCDGTIRFFGKHHETGKDRVGVELDEAVGKHSGTVKDNEYFKCAKKCGILVDPSKVSVQAMV